MITYEIDSIFLINVLKIIKNTKQLLIINSNDYQFLCNLKNKTNKKTGLYLPQAIFCKDILLKKYPNSLFNNDNLKFVLDEYFKNRKNTIEKYGPIEIWNLSNVNYLTKLKLSKKYRLKILLKI